MSDRQPEFSFAGRAASAHRGRGLSRRPHLATAFAAAALIAIFILAASPLRAMDRAASQKASELYQKHDWSGLANLAAPFTRADRNDGWAWYYLGLADDGLGRRDQAVAAYENARGLVPEYLRGSVVQLLAQDYAALHQSDKLAGLYHVMQKSHPDIATSLQSQFRDVLSTPVAAAPLPDISPRTVAAMTADARRAWRRDALPVMVNVQDIGKGFQVVYDFYSPSAKSGFQIVQALGGTSNSQVANARWGVEPIPSNFLPLDAAVARAPAAGAPGRLDHAFLYRGGGGGTEAVDLSWDLAMISDSVRGASIAAYIMPKDQFDRLLRDAQGGNTNAQVVLARVYTLGVAGAPDPRLAFQWCAQAAAHGNAEAENMLGQMYEFGRGTAPDARLAVHWYQLAANAGFAPAE